MFKNPDEVTGKLPVKISRKRPPKNQAGADRQPLSNHRVPGGHGGFLFFSSFIPAFLYQIQLRDPLPFFNSCCNQADNNDPGQDSAEVNYAVSDLAASSRNKVLVNLVTYRI